MALVPCRECGEQVATTAAACPRCGVKHPDATQARRAVTAGYVGIAVLAVIGVAAVVAVMTLLGV